jgi:hypothetical protein
MSAPRFASLVFAGCARTLAIALPLFLAASPASCAAPSAPPQIATQDLTVSAATRTCPEGSAWDGTRCVLGRAADAGPTCDGEWSGSVCVTKVEVTCPPGMQLESGKGCALSSRSVRGAWTAPLRQSGTLADARQHFMQGMRLYAAGDFVGALGELETAYAISPTPPVLYNIGVCLQSLSRLDEALDVLERFIADSAGGSGAGNVTSAKTRAATLRARLGGTP